ncbi:hypothetical protein AWB81_05863 [Caballeronia arationis]|nr:hypothetical protein AWB81_05863 [Caballeronia arationis]
MTLLRERMQHDMLIRNLAENTQTSYLKRPGNVGDFGSWL